MCRLRRKSPVKRGRVELSERMRITVRARQNTKERNRRCMGVRGMACFEVAKCFEKSFNGFYL